jgi:hypothetical protein
MGARDAAGNGATVRILPTSPKYILRAANFTLKDADGKRRPGVGIFVDRALVQHLTANQAVALADQLHDAAEARTL